MQHAHPGEGEEFVFVSSKRRVKCPFNFIGLPGHGMPVFGGFFGGATYDLTPEELVEVSNHMLERWQRVKNSASKIIQQKAEARAASEGQD